MSKLFKSAGNIDMESFNVRARSRSTKVSSSAPSSTIYTCHVHIKDNSEGKYKFKFHVYSVSSELSVNNENDVIHLKFDTPFRNAPLLVTKWKKANRRADKSDLIGCFICVPMRLKMNESAVYKLHTLPKSEYYTDTPTSDTIELKADWTRRTNRELIAHWSFDKISNLNLHPAIQDISGKGFHVQLKNLNTDNPLLCHGVKHSSYAIFFSGFNYLISERNPLKGMSEFSISFWFKYAPGHHTDDTVLLSCIKSIESDSLDPLADYDPTSVKSLSENELFVNELFHGPKYRVLLNRDSQYLSVPTQTESGPNRRSRSSSFTEVITDAFTSRASALPFHKRNKSLNSTIEIGFSIGTKKNTFTDYFGSNLVLSRKKHQKRKQYDTVYGRVLNKSLNDSENIGPDDLAILSNPELEEEGEDEDVFIEDDDTTTEAFERTDFFKNDDWNHLVISYSGDRLREYINGTLTDDRRGTFTTLGDANRLVIGAMTDGYSFSGFRGAIDELKMFNYALNSTEIRALHSWKDQRTRDEYAV